MKAPGLQPGRGAPHISELLEGRMELGTPAPSPQEDYFMKGGGFSWAAWVGSCGETSQAHPHPREGVCMLFPAQVPKPFGAAAEEAQRWEGGHGPDLL